MSSNNISSINNYTLFETGEPIKYYFYPQYALIEEKVLKKLNEFHILFELEKENTEKLYKLYVHIINSEGEKTYSTYSTYAKKIQKGKYAILPNKTVIKEENYEYKTIINFDKLNYDNFIELLSKEKNFSRMIPELQKELKNSMKILEEKKTKVKKMEFPTPLVYYQNINGYFITEIEKKLITSSDIGISETILKNIRKNYDVLFKDTNQIKLSYINLYAIILNKLKSTSTKPSSILPSKELKIELELDDISSERFKTIIKSLLNNQKEELEEDEKALYETLTNYFNKLSKNEYSYKIKNIFCHKEKLDDLKKTRYVKENVLKEVLLNCLCSLNYYPLPNNQILLYNEENEKIDFLTIININKLYTLLKTYKKSTNVELKEQLNIIKQLELMIESKETKITENNTKIHLLILILINIYNHKNINKNSLLFEKGDYIIDLSFQKGEYDISIIHGETNKKYGRITKLSEESKIKIKESLNKSEKAFTKYINNIVFENLEYALKELKIDISIENYTHDGVEISIKKPKSKDIFECTFNAKQLLLILSNIKESKELVNSNKDIKKETIIKDNDLTEKEIEYIIRKSKTIMEIMATKKLNNNNYKKIVELYEKLFQVEHKEKLKILLELKELI